MRAATSDYVKLGVFLVTLNPKPNCQHQQSHSRKRLFFHRKIFKFFKYKGFPNKGDMF